MEGRGGAGGREEKCEGQKRRRGSRRLCIFALSAISHGYIRDLWLDLDSISRRGLLTYWPGEYARRLSVTRSCSGQRLSRGFVRRADIETRGNGDRPPLGDARNSDLPPESISTFVVHLDHVDLASRRDRFSYTRFTRVTLLSDVVGNDGLSSLGKFLLADDRDSFIWRHPL